MWGLFVAIGGFIAGLFQGGIDAVVTALVWAVGALQAGAFALWNGIKAAVDLTRLGFIKAWDFLGTLYDDVLKPAWQTFWRWFDKLRTWLNNTFGPLLKWLRDLRTSLLEFWKDYVRPWLDLIDVTRKGLRVLASLGLTWARELDKQLAALEDKIEAPFRFVLGKLNEVINVVDTIVDGFGLFQRLTLIRSLTRDYQFVWKAIVAPYSTPIHDGARDAIRTAIAARTLNDVETDFRKCLNGQGGRICDAAANAGKVFRARLAGG